MKRADLVSCAEELNKEMGLTDPPIDVKAKVKDLKTKIAEAAELIDSNEDDFSEQTWSTLEELGVASRPAQEHDANEIRKQEEQNESEEPEPEKQEQESEGNEESEEEDLLAKVRKTSKLQDLKIIVKEDDTFKKLRENLDDYQGLHGPKQLKTEMFKILGVDPEQEKKQDKQSKSKRQQKTEKTKKQVVTDMVSKKKGATLEEIAQAITDEGIDPDVQKNKRVTRLWLRKIGFEVTKDENGCYKRSK